MTDATPTVTVTLPNLSSAKGPEQVAAIRRAISPASLSLLSAAVRVSVADLLASGTKLGTSHASALAVYGAVCEHLTARHHEDVAAAVALIPALSRTIPAEAFESGENVHAVTIGDLYATRLGLSRFATAARRGRLESAKLDLPDDLR